MKYQEKMIYFPISERTVSYKTCAGIKTINQWLWVFVCLFLVWVLVFFFDVLPPSPPPRLTFVMVDSIFKLLTSEMSKVKTLASSFYEDWMSMSLPQRKTGEIRWNFKDSQSRRESKMFLFFKFAYWLLYYILLY